MPDSPTNVEEQLATGAAQVATDFAALARQEQMVVVDDPMAALSDDNEEIELHIPTGREDTEGRAVKVRVMVVDPKRPEIALGYLASENKDRAALELWRAMIKTPAVLVDEDYFFGTNNAGKNPSLKKPTTAFRNALTFRLLRILGVDGSFFEEMESMVPPKALRAATRSSSPSPHTTASPPAKSGSTSPPANSGTLSASLPANATSGGSRP